jgi:hypothetical protein
MVDSQIQALPLLDSDAVGLGSTSYWDRGRPRPQPGEGGLYQKTVRPSKACGQGARGPS